MPSINLTGLKPSTTYSLYIQSQNDEQTSQPSNILYFTTPADYVTAENAVSTMRLGASGAIYAGSVGGQGVFLDSKGLRGTNSSGASTFFLSAENGNANFAGTVTASIGKIGGYTLAADRLYSNTLSLEGSQITASINALGSVNTLKLSTYGNFTYAGFYQNGVASTNSGFLKLDYQGIPAYDGFYLINGDSNSLLNNFYGDSNLGGIRMYRTPSTPSQGLVDIHLGAGHPGRIKLDSTSGTAQIDITTGADNGPITLNDGRTGAIKFGDGRIYSGTNVAAVATVTSRLMIAGPGAALDQSWLWIARDQSSAVGNTATDPALFIQMLNGTSASGLANSRAISLYTGSILAGYVRITDYNTVALVSVSDYRAKQDVSPIFQPIDTVKKLNPISFRLKIDPTTGWKNGFLAHELQEIIPYAVDGQKDAVDKDGNPEYQHVTMEPVIPILTAATKELIDKIEILEQRIAALENK